MAFPIQIVGKSAPFRVRRYGVDSVSRQTNAGSVLFWSVPFVLAFGAAGS